VVIIWRENQGGGSPSVNYKTMSEAFAPRVEKVVINPKKLKKVKITGVDISADEKLRLKEEMNVNILEDEDYVIVDVLNNGEKLSVTKASDSDAIISETFQINTNKLSKTILLEAATKTTQKEVNDKPTSSTSSSTSGYNWSGLFILGLFVVPLIGGGVAYLMNIFFPQLSSTSTSGEPLWKIEDRVRECYKVANPSKLNDVSKIVKKYGKKPEKLYRQLDSKYNQFSECSIEQLTGRR